jgi:predicted CopG family antitoxin
MAEAKTKPTKESVDDFISKVADEKRRNDCQNVLKIMKEVVQAEPEMWGTSIVGFGRYRQKGSNGKEVEWMIMGFSPRKTDLTLYILPGVESFPDIMSRLGKHKTGKSCIYLKKLDDIDLNVLKELASKSLEVMSEKRVDKV